MPVCRSADSNRIDLALTRGIPRFLDVLTAIQKEMAIESVTLATEILENSPEIYAQIESNLNSFSIQYVSHEHFKELLTKTKGIVRTGECTPYANIILSSGVNF